MSLGLYMVGSVVELLGLSKENIPGDSTQWPDQGQMASWCYGATRDLLKRTSLMGLLHMFRVGLLEGIDVFNSADGWMCSLHWIDVQSSCFTGG